MALRSAQNLTNAMTDTYRNVTAIASRGTLGKFGAADDEVTPAAAGEAGMGVYLEDAAIGDVTTIVLLAGACIVPVKVGTGGTATRGSYAIAGTAGFTNQVIGGGTVARNIVGIFMQSGVPGDMVGLLPVINAAVSV